MRGATMALGDAARRPTQRSVVAYQDLGLYAADAGGRREFIEQIPEQAAVATLRENLVD